MNVEARLSDLYAQLEQAEDALNRARLEWQSCQINTPGRCSREADRVAAAEKRVHDIELSIRRVYVDAQVG